MTLTRFLAILALPAFVAACAQQEEPPVIQGELMFDKYGGAVGCTEGVFLPNAPQQWQCRPPEDQCETSPNLSRFDPRCLPPRQRQPGGNGDDGGGQRTNPNNPTGQP